MNLTVKQRGQHIKMMQWIRVKFPSSWTWTILSHEQVSLSWTEPHWRKNSIFWLWGGPVAEMLCVLPLHLFSWHSLGLLPRFFTIKMKSAELCCDTAWIALNHGCNSLSREIIRLNHWKLAFLHVKSGQMSAASYGSASHRGPLILFWRRIEVKVRTVGDSRVIHFCPCGSHPFLCWVTFREMKLWLLLIAAHQGTH